MNKNEHQETKMKTKTPNELCMLVKMRLPFNLQTEKKCFKILFQKRFVQICIFLMCSFYGQAAHSFVIATCIDR